MSVRDAYTYTVAFVYVSISPHGLYHSVNKCRERTVRVCVFVRVHLHACEWMLAHTHQEMVPTPCFSIDGIWNSLSLQSPKLLLAYMLPFLALPVA